MPSALPAALSSCLKHCLAYPSQLLVTSVLDASANWLVIRIISAVTYGIEQNDHPTNQSEAIDQRPTHIFVSFLRPLDLWLEIGKKINLDIASLVATKRLAYIDGLTGGTTTTGIKCHPLRSHSLQDISASIQSARQSLRPQSAQTSVGSVIILDGIDFILASQTDITQQQLSRFLSTLHENFENVVITASADFPLTHNTDSAATPLELKHGTFLRVAAHQSSFLLQVRPLETGSAKDVSGVLRFSKGGMVGDADADHPDSEWLYQAKGDGNLRIWSRGE